MYGDGKLKVYKIIKADIATRNKVVHHEICVVHKDKGANLLSRTTSIELGVLEIHVEIFNVTEAKEPPIGKLKGVQVEIKNRQQRETNSTSVSKSSDSVEETSGRQDSRSFEARYH